MKPLEAYSIISRVFDEYHSTKCYSINEVIALVMAFEALRRMEEENNDTD